MKKFASLLVLSLTSSTLSAADLKEFSATPTKEDAAILAQPDHVLRIEKDLEVKWKGVKHCENDVEKRFYAVFDRWVGESIRKYKDQHYLTSGHEKGTANCSSSKALDGKRSCGCEMTVKSYVDFEKN